MVLNTLDRVAVVGVEDGENHLGGLGVLHLGGCLPRLGEASVAVPGRVNELVGARGTGASRPGRVVASGLQCPDRRQDCGAR